MSEFQWAASAFSLIYIFFAVRNNPICFIFGVIGCGLWSYESFVNLNLKFDGFLQLFYVMMSFWGLYQWKYGGTQKTELPIQQLPRMYHVVIIIVGVFLSLLIGELGRRFLDTNLPILDAATTAFSILATFLLVQRYKSNWIYFIICNMVYVYIYGMQEAWTFVGMMAVYTIMAFIGYYNWNVKEENQNTPILN